MTAPQSSDWSATTQWYDQNTQAFISRADALNPSEDLETFASQLPAGARVLDLGCGSGRDLATFLHKGFNAHGLDGSRNLAAHAARRIGSLDRVRHMTFDDYADEPQSWDGIWAMASLIHVPREDRTRVFSKVLASLRPGGIFTAFFKSGQEDIIDGAGRAISLMDKKDALQAFLPLLTSQQRISARSVIRKDSRGDIIEWTGVEVRS